MKWKTIAIVISALFGLVLIGLLWWAATYDYNRLKPLIADQTQSLLGKKLDIEGDLAIRLRLPPTLTAENIRLQNASWGSRPDMLTVKRLEIQIGLWALWNHALEILELRLVEPDILIEQAARTGNFNWEPPPPAESAPTPTPSDAPPTDNAEFKWSLEGLTVEKGHIRWVDHADGRTENFDITQLRLERQSGPLPVKSTFEGRYNDRRFALEGASQLFGHIIRKRWPWPFDFRLETEGDTLSLKGAISARPQDMAHRPELSLTVQGERLDLRPWLASSGSNTHTGTGSKSPARIFSKAPLPFDALGALDGRLDLDLTHLLTPRFSLKDVKMTLQLDKGLLTVDPISAVAGGGDVSGSVSIDARSKTPRASAKFTITQMNAALMMKELRLREGLEGILDVRIDLNAQGRSTADWAASLGGYTQLVSGKGHIKGRFFGIFSKGITRQLLGMFGQEAARQQGTPINCLVMRTDSNAGQVAITHLVIDTPQTSILGDGRIDLKTEHLDIGLKPAPKRGVISLGGLTRPFRLGGTLAEPAMEVDPTESAITVGKLVGGVALFGPVGIAAALAGISADDENPCLSAIQAAEKGVTVDKHDESASGSDGANQEKGFFKSMGDRLKRLGGEK